MEKIDYFNNWIKKINSEMFSYKMFLTLLHYSLNTCATNPEFPQMVKQANINPVFGKRKRNQKNI